MTNTKICVKCGGRNPLADFVIDRRKRDGRTGRCKACLKTESKVRYHANRERVAGQRRKSYQERVASFDGVVVLTKRCASCETTKPSGEFHTNPGRHGGLSPWCIPCTRTDNGDRQDRNRDRYAAISEAWRQNNLERDADNKAKYHQENQQAISERHRKWREENREDICAKAKQHNLDFPEKNQERGRRYRAKYPDHGRAKSAKRRAMQQQAIPSWADLDAIKDIYKNCPSGYHVDHIIPIKAMRGRKRVACGLHCESNLQYLPAAENISKGAKLPEDAAAA